MLDTTAIARLVSFWKRTSGLALDDHEVIDENFRSIRDIVDLLYALR